MMNFSVLKPHQELIQKGNERIDVLEEKGLRVSKVSIN